MQPDGTWNKLRKSIELPAGMRDCNVRDALRLLGIMSEFVAASDKLSQIQLGASILGGAHGKGEHPHYAMTEHSGRLLSDAGWPQP